MWLSERYLNETVAFILCKSTMASVSMWSLGFGGVYRGVAQLVVCVLWEHDVAGSSPVTPTDIYFVGDFNWKEHS